MQDNLIIAIKMIEYDIEKNISLLAKQQIINLRWIKRLSLTEATLEFLTQLRENGQYNKIEHDISNLINIISKTNLDEETSACLTSTPKELIVAGFTKSWEKTGPRPKWFKEAVHA